MNEIKKFIGIMCIVFSAVLAFGALSEFEENTTVSIFILFLASLPVYLLGQGMRTSWIDFKSKIKGWLVIYVYCTMIVPLIFYSYETYEGKKQKAMIDGKYILYEPGASELSSLSLIFMIVLLLFIAIRFFSPDLKRKRLLTGMIVGTVFLYGGFQYIIWSDYRGVHQELGLVSQSWNGKRTVQSFDEIKGIYVQPSIHRAKLSDSTDETEFTWKLIFVDHHNEKVEYHFQSLSRDSLETAQQIKEIAHDRQIPFQINDMNDEVFKWFDLELELQKLNKEPFYQFFELNHS
ncbi:hypothetical protein J22TS1_16550 [Siminovitchia terrae]|uniref:hypothetical protein n=1 Tax=Siminovitchia terrae TaxID=1914933 RepID=UPI001B21BAB0|nr:hypothetical protein [Siminovitchia terrae]GIN90604.1 hypothetical protein J22TS1_16550 [Siminovitchia terrae]